MEITRSKRNSLGLWSLILVFMSCIIELLLGLSTVSVCLQYLDSVARLKVHGALTNMDMVNYFQILFITKD